MKKILIIILLFVSTIVSAQVYTYRTTAFTSNINNGYGWSGWSKWESSNIILTIDLNNDLVTVYSRAQQIYKIVESVGSYIDNDGDTHLLFHFIDQDYDRGTLRLLQRRSGSSEVYIEFSNVKWCYQVRRI